MGLLRFLLAACVIVGHSSDIPLLRMLDAGVAVKSFFVISGFYMAMILDSKYNAREAEGRWLFWSNRFLRIYPLYWLTLLFAVLFYVAASWKLGRPADRFQLWVDAWQSGQSVWLGFLAVAQGAIIGLDIPPAFFFTTNEGFSLLGGATADVGTPGWRFNLLPHCWSVGVEILFYAIIPWLVRWSSKTLWVVIGLVVTATVAFFGVAPLELAKNVTYHFFPFQLSYFVLGILCFRSRDALTISGTSRMVCWMLMGVCLLWGRWLPLLAQYLVVVPLSFLVIPSLFAASARSKIDRLIGELSYPMYLIHIPVRWCVLVAVGSKEKTETFVSGAQLLVLTALLALVVHYVFDRPIERLRAKRVA